MASFPWYGTATSLFVSWANTLRAEASSWNEFWTKLKEDGVQFSDWAKVMAGSVEAFTSFSEQFWLTMLGPAAPPWANLPFPLKESVPVRILKAVNEDNPIEPVLLTLLGGHQQGDRLYVQAAISGPYEIKLFIDDAAWKKSPPQEGQYIGLVFSREHPDPIAIVSIKVSQEDVDRFKAPPEKKNQEIAIIDKNVGGS